MDSLGIDVESAFGVIASDRFARDWQSARRGFVKHRRSLGERAENLFSRIIEPGPRRIRLGQIENARAGSLHLFDQPRESVRLQTPFESVGKHIGTPAQYRARKQAAVLSVRRTLTPSTAFVYARHSTRAMIRPQRSRRWSPRA